MGVEHERRELNLRFEKADPFASILALSMIQAAYAAVSNTRPNTSSRAAMVAVGFEREPSPNVQPVI
jgi:hypothetical protein